MREDLFGALERPISLTPDALLDVYFGWMRHTTGKEIPATLNCAACGHDIEVFAEVAEIAPPDADY